jgi:hypothetical protein
MQTAFAVKDGVPALRFETRSTASMPNPWNLYKFGDGHAAIGGARRRMQHKGKHPKTSPD